MLRNENFSKQNLHKLVHNSDTRWGRIFAFTIQLLIIISLITFSLETLPNLTDNQYSVLQGIELVIIIFFVVNIYCAFMSHSNG